MATTALLAKWAQSDAVLLSTSEAAELLECDRENISVMASTPEGRDAMGIEVIRIGSRTKIPRIPLLRKLGWEGEIKGATA